MNRRNLTKLSVAAALPGAASAAHAAETPKTYVLLHGAWHGGWCWQHVAPALRARGHAVYTPTQTGLGDRAHLLTRDVGIEIFIQDVMALIEMEELTNIILVGHSFAGNVVTCVVDRMPERIAHLVYLDAAIPNEGESVFSLLPAGMAEQRMQLAMQTSGGVSLPVPKPEAFGVTAADDAAWLARHLRPHPLKTYTDPVHFAHPPGNGRPVTYIACVKPAYPPLASSHEYARKQPTWTYQEIGCAHDAMVLAPGQLAELLLAVRQ